MIVRNIFEAMVAKGASDLYLRANATPRARINGQVTTLMPDVVLVDSMQALTNLILAKEQRKHEFAQKMDIDFIHVEEGVGRFRINMFMQRGSPAIVARHVQSHIQSFKELNLPVELCEVFSEETKGLLLLCGPAGNGKSTTIASMIDNINARQSKHIITIEDPIEFLFEDKKSIINQRELGIDVPTYPSALKHVTQQSPDIIYIGNVRDEDTMRAAITATELGTFVMTTLHTVNAVQTLVRMVNFFPPHLHDEVRMQLSLIMRGTISLRLLPCKDGQGRIPAYETMVVTPTIARLIREGRFREIQNYIDEGELFGMRSFKKSLVHLVKEELVDEDVARQYADSKDDFNLALKGVQRMGE